MSKADQATNELEKIAIHARVDDHDGMRFVSFDAEYADVDALYYWKDDHPVDYIEMALRNEDWAADVYRMIIDDPEIESIKVGYLKHDGESIQLIRYSNPFHADRLEDAVVKGGD